MYYHSLKVTEKALLEKVQYTAGKLVTGALQLTSKLKLEELGWETIQSRANILGYSIFHKINKGKTRQLVRSCLPARKNCPHTPRFGGFVPFPYHNLKFTNSLSPYFTSKYNKFEKHVKAFDTVEFKNYIVNKLKPQKYKHYARGPKYSNTLLSRMM